MRLISKYFFGEKRNIINKESCIYFFEITLMFIMCLLHSIVSGYNVNFYPINGTFQNFNPVRRLLAGQIPYQDFQDYLGMGHLYLGTIITALFGGNYRASLQAFSFLTFFSFALSAFLISNIIIKKKEFAVAFTNIILVVLLIQPFFLRTSFVGTSEILEALEYSLGTGNSARFIRGMIMPGACLLLWTGYKIYEKLLVKRAIVKWKNFIIYAGIGIVAGVSFIWSNDYGISCWLCILIMCFWIVYSRERKLLLAFKNFFVSFAVSIVAIFISIEIVTIGHFDGWMSATFGTGGYQRWYYHASTSWYLYDVDFSCLMLIQVGMAIAYLIKLYVKRGTVDAIWRYGTLGFLNLTSFCAVNEYHVLSGGISREFALSILFLNIFCECVYFLGKNLIKMPLKKVLLMSSVILGLSWTISTLKDELIYFFMTDKAGVKVEALGGNLTDLGTDLIETDNFLKGQNFWSTYASAQEVVAGKFQPSGTDYIIHVLGDKQRETYLQDFANEEFTYAATIRKSFTDWEYWIERANWWFYRKLYKDWHPVYANTYELYWERNDSDGENLISDGFTYKVVDVNEGTKKIIVQGNSNINGVADVYIDYIVKKKNNNSAKITIQKSLKVENTGTIFASAGSDYEYNFLRDESAEYIPIQIINGYGEVTLTSNPQRSTYLELKDVNCEEILTVSYLYATINTIDRDNDTFVILNTKKNTNLFQGVNQIEYADRIYNVNEIISDENNLYIKVHCKIKDDASEKNQIKIIR